MDFAPVDLVFFRRSSLVPQIGRKVAKSHNISFSEIIILQVILSLTTDAAKGVTPSSVVAAKIYKNQSVYLYLTRLYNSGLVESRKRVKSARHTLYITELGFRVLEHFSLAVKRAERERYGSRQDKTGSAKGGRISRKPKK